MLEPMARIRVQEPLRIFVASRAGNVGKRLKKKKRVRADKSLMVFDRLAFTSPAKSVTSLLPQPSVLAADHF
jgi:hypothetical protein